MNDSSVNITALCEKWWERMADATKQEQLPYAEELLRILGWKQPIPFTPREGAEALSAAPFLLRAGGQTAVCVYFLMPGAIDPPSAVVGRGLDFCAATRTLVSETHGLNVQYVLVTDLCRSYFYDVRTDELMLYADDPKAFNSTFLPVLTRANMERGALDEIRRQPRSMVATQLREWREHWTGALETQAGLSAEKAGLVIDRLLVIRYLFDHDIFRRTKWRLERRFAALMAAASETAPGNCGEELIKLFHDMWFDWRIDLFEGDPELDAALQGDRTAAALLKEFALLSRGKFNIATILESFNYGDPSEKMRVRMVPDIDEERDLYLAAQTLHTIDAARIEINLREEGYRAIFHWFDKVVDLYERLEVDFDAQTYRNMPQARELDLFQWSELDANRPDACADKMAYACRHGFGIHYDDPRQYRVARLCLTLHLISRYAQTRQPVDTLPSLKRVLKARPENLSATQVMNLSPRVQKREELESVAPARITPEQRREIA